MAEKQEAKKNEEAAPPEAGKGKKGKFMLIGAIGGAMVIEGAAVFFLARMMGGGPQNAAANVPGLTAEGGEAGAGAEGEKAGGHGEGAKGGEGGGDEDVKEPEVTVGQFRAINDRTGQNILYDVKVFGRVKRENAEKVKKLLETRKATIEDRLAKVLRLADPQCFKEPGFDTIRRQVMHELDLAFGEEDLIIEILLPSLMWYNVGG